MKQNWEFLSLASPNNYNAAHHRDRHRLELFARRFFQALTLYKPKWLAANSSAISWQLSEACRMSPFSRSNLISCHCRRACLCFIEFNLQRDSQPFDNINTAVSGVGRQWIYRWLLVKTVVYCFDAKSFRNSVNLLIIMGGVNYFGTDNRHATRNGVNLRCIRDFLVLEQFDNQFDRRFKMALSILQHYLVFW